MSEPNPIEEAKTGASAEAGVKKVNRRQMLGILGITLNAIAGALFAVPIIGYVLGPATRRQLKKDIEWVTLGTLEKFPVGQTRLGIYRNPLVHQWDGATGDVPCWVRRIAADKLQVFAINCAHLGCPVRWFPQAGLFMCPCHGGVYYENGARASGPPPRGLFQYDYKVEQGQLWIKAGQMPTLATPPSSTSACAEQFRRFECV
jgi:menaquinol-cytochrome c reductase iron-sulfur subunit